MSAEDLKKQEKRKKAKANMKMMLSKIAKGTLEFKRVFLVYFLILATCVIVFGILQTYPNLENTLSASRTTPWGIITAIFTHSNLSHLTNNMVFLFLFMFLFALCGSTFSPQSKRKIEIFFLVSTFVFAVLANILWIALTPNRSIGASGLVYAIEGSLVYFSLYNGLQLLNFSKFKAQSLSTKYIVILNILACLSVLIQIALSPAIFLNVGQNINSFAHGSSFLLGFFINPFWYLVVKKISILDTN
jgi:membrane associated rhomboid family serine protease